jgi:hypothetical protein
MVDLTLIPLVEAVVVPDNQVEMLTLMMVELVVMV